MPQADHNREMRMAGRHESYNVSYMDLQKYIVFAPEHFN